MSYLRRKKKSGVLKKGAQESGLALHRLAGTASSFCQATQGGRRMVGQRVLLQITPNVFHGIEFGGVGREVFQIEAEMPVKEPFDFSGQVGARAIPDHHEVSWQLAEQLQEKVQGSIRVDVLVRVQTEVEVKSVASGRHGQRANTRDLLTGPAVLIENGGLAARSPGATHQRGHQKAGFVEENQMRLQPGGFFLMRGHSFLTSAGFPARCAPPPAAPAFGA